MAPLRAPAFAGEQGRANALFPASPSPLSQGVLVGPAVRRWGDRKTMVIGLAGGAIGIACMGLSPTGIAFTLSMFPNALWGLSMPTLQALMTKRVSESEQGQLQGANMSVASIAGIASPLFFGFVYSVSVGDTPLLPHPGASFFIASAILLSGALIGRQVGRRRHDAAPA